MSEVRAQVERLLDELPLTEGQRVLYRRGADRLSEDELRRVAREMEAGLAAAPSALDAANALLRRRRSRDDPKTALVVVRDQTLGAHVASLLRDVLDVRPVEELEALDILAKMMVNVVVLDFHLPTMNALEFIDKVRRNARMRDPVVLVRTEDANEVGQLARRHVSSFPTSMDARALSNAVLSAAEP